MDEIAAGWAASGKATVRVFGRWFVGRRAARQDFGAILGLLD